MTYTCALLAIPPAAFAEVKARIDRVNQNGDYNHMFNKGSEGPWIDMTHIGIVAETSPTPTYDAAEIVTSALGSALHDGMEFRVDIADGKRFTEELKRLGYSIVRDA